MNIPGSTFSTEKRVFANDKELGDYKIMYDKAYSHHSRNEMNNKGYSFGKGYNSKQALEEQFFYKDNADIKLGPGYYNASFNGTLPKSASFYISFENFRIESDKSQTNIPYINPGSTMIESGYQRFLKSERFPNNKTYSYKRILAKHDKSNSNIISRNKNNTTMYEPKAKSELIEYNSQIRNKRILSAQRNKKILDERQTERIIKYNREIERRKLMNKEKKNENKIIQRWIFMFTFINCMKAFIRRFIIKKKAKKHSGKLIVIFKAVSKTIAKFLKILKKFKIRKSLVKIKCFVSIQKSMWRLRRRAKSKLLTSGFIMEYARLYAFKLLIMKIAKGILAIQHWYRRCLVRKYIMLSAMCIQWSSIEYVLIKKNHYDPIEEKAEILSSIKIGRAHV